jgi:deoxyhypusine monooxygenase
MVNEKQAGEALGAIGSAEALPVLEQFAKDPLPEVAETCMIALDRLKWLQLK